MKQLTFKRLSETAKLPTRNHPSDAGLDLYADESYWLGVNDWYAVKTGVAVSIPEGYYGRLAPRSGLASEWALGVLAGVVDSSYRGELKVILVNHGIEPFVIAPDARIAQLIIEKIETPEAVWGEIDDTERGEKGFGASGV